MAALPDRPLLLLTDRTLLTPNWTLAQAVAPCITGGANIVVFRESELPDSPRLTIASFVKDGVGGRVPFLVAGTPEFALKAGADGLLIEEQSASVAAAKDAVGPDRLLGVVVSSKDRLRSAQSEGADFALVNLDWTATENALGILRQYCAEVSKPIIAGVDMDIALVAPCVGAGAMGVAICSVGMESYDRTSAVREYAAALRAATNGTV